MSTPRPRSRRGEGERLRTEILAAAEALLVETADPEAVSIRAITEAVGITAPSIYRHFHDKDALLYAVCVQAWARFDDYVETHSRSDDPLEALKLRALAYVRFGLEHPGHYRVLFMTPLIQHKSLAAAVAEQPLPPPPAPGLDATIDGFLHLVEGIRRAMGAGVMIERDPMQLALLLWAAVHGIVSLRLTLPDLGWPSVEAQVDEFFDAVAFGLCPLARRGEYPAAQELGHELN